jgi:two-component system, NarL family, response regulator NreC
MSMLRVVLADDHHVVRAGLRTLLERALPCQVIGEAADGQAAIELVTRLKPDVLVVDLMMPDITGIAVVREIRLQAPATHIVMLSMHADELYVREALRAGATAYVLKEALANEFVTAVRAAAHGRRYLSHTLSERVLAQYIQQQNDSTHDPYELLTERERAVLHRAALGYTAVEIGQQLALSPRTIETYRTNLLQKLGLRHQTDLVRYAIKRGIIGLDT